jgi:hypothetical protein
MVFKSFVPEKLEGDTRGRETASFKKGLIIFANFFLKRSWQQLDYAGFL